MIIGTRESVVGSREPRETFLILLVPKMPRNRQPERDNPHNDDLVGPSRSTSSSPGEMIMMDVDARQ